MPQRFAPSSLKPIVGTLAALIITAVAAAAQEPAFGMHGDVAVARSTGPGPLPSSAPRSVVNQDLRAKLEKQLNKIAKHSKRGEKAVAFRRLLLKAMAAPSWEEYNQIMRPFHEGRRIDLIQDLGPGSGATTTADVSGHVRRSGPALEECTTELYGETFVDECTTDADVDPVWAELDAMQAELDANMAEEEEECTNHVDNPDDCWETSPRFYLSDWSTQELLSDSSPMPFDGAAMPECTGSNAPSVQARVKPYGGCIGEGIMAAGALVLWATEKGAFKGAGKKIAWTALTRTQGRLLLGGFLAGFAIGTALNCWWEDEM